MEEVEKRGKERIDSKRDKIKSLSFETDGCTIANLAIEGTVEDLIKEQEKFIGSSKKLKELGNLKGKISNKASTDHKHQP